MALPTHGIRRGGSGSFSTFVVGLNDAMLLVLAVLLFPLIILLVGAPIALMVRALIEIAHGSKNLHERGDPHVRPHRRGEIPAFTFIWCWFDVLSRDGTDPRSWPSFRRCTRARAWHDWRCKRAECMPSVKRRSVRLLATS